MGLMVMLVLGPLIAAMGITYIAMAKAPHTTNFTALRVLGTVANAITQGRRP